MKQFTLGKYTLDDFADFLNGENEYFAGIEGGELLLTGEHKLTKTLNMHFPLTIKGQDATIVGMHNGNYAFSMQSSDTCVCDLHLNNFILGAEIDALGGVVENVWVKNIVMHGGLNCVEVGSSVSNSTLRNIHIDSCTAIVAHEEWEEETFTPMALTYNICCARHKGGGVIENCLLEDVYVNNCKKLGQSRIAINFMSGMPAGTDMFKLDTAYENLVSRNINVTNNYIECCWDGAIAFLAKYVNNGSASIDGITVSGNHCYHGIAGLYIFGTEQIFGEANDARISNVVVSHNHFECGIEDVGEPVRGIFVSATRADPFTMTSIGCSIENLEICHNTLDGSGIVLAGAYTMGDIPLVQTNNTVKNTNIHHNTITNADVAFQFDGVQMEGRMYDWNFGYPRHDKKWGEHYIDHSIQTSVLTDNRIENLTVTDNTIEGYRYRVVASGANGHGHGVCTGNKVCGEVVFENNHYGIGENHIHVADMITDDYVTDNGGNTVSMAFKQNKELATNCVAIHNKGA